MQLLRRSDSNSRYNVRPAAGVPDHRVSKKQANEGVKNVRIVTSSLGPTLYIIVCQSFKLKCGQYPAIHTNYIISQSNTLSSSLGSRCVPWLGEGISMSSPNYPVLCCPLPYRVAPVFVQVVSPPLGWSPLSSFLVIWSPSVDARGPSVVYEAANMPCPGPFHFSHSVDYIYEFCPLPDPDVGPSIFVCDVEHTSFHFGLCGRKFVLCLFGQCPGLCTIWHCWQHTGVVHLSLQADGKVAFEDIPVFGVCRPACHDSSLYLFVLVLFLEAVVLSQQHVAWDIFYQHIVHVYRGVVYNHHLCLCDVHLKTHSSTFIG